ncbi:MAG: hypothetical protein LBT53_01070 [Puniceicoccales bacterium]|jgi:hypothetical protein|nr:hypothetical protein [Puniceicoccales bacterium]
MTSASANNNAKTTFPKQPAAARRAGFATAALLLTAAATPAFAQSDTHRHGIAPLTPEQQRATAQTAANNAAATEAANKRATESGRSHGIAPLAPEQQSTAAASSASTSPSTHRHGIAPLTPEQQRATAQADAAAEASKRVPPDRHSHGIAPLTPEQQRADEAYRNRKPHSGEITFSAFHVFDTGANINNFKGWGGALNFSVLPPRSQTLPNSLLKFGAEISGFRVTASGGREADAGVLSVVGGASHTFGDFLEVGATLGFGLAGTYCETLKSNGHRDYNGNINWAMHVRPELAFHLTRNVALTASYRFGFITPIVRTEYRFLSKNDLEYKTIDMTTHAFEAGVRLRF